MTCGATEICKDGVCVATCDPPCAGNTVCDLAQTPPTCVESQCAVDACPKVPPVTMSMTGGWSDYTQRTVGRIAG